VDGQWREFSFVTCYQPNDFRVLVSHPAKPLVLVPLHVTCRLVMITCLEKHFQHTPSSLAGYSKEKKRKEYENREKIIVNSSQKKR
jgi:hypothetical protein